MKVVEAKQLVLDLLVGRGSLSDASVLVNSDSPDGDPGKFVIDGKVARAIHHYDGWYVPINLGWFNGGFEEPIINKEAPTLEPNKIAAMIGKIVYPKPTGDKYANVRSSANVNNGLINNIIGKIFIMTNHIVL